MLDAAGCQDSESTESTPGARCVRDSPEIELPCEEHRIGLLKGACADDVRTIIDCNTISTGISASFPFVFVRPRGVCPLLRARVMLNYCSPAVAKCSMHLPQTPLD